MARNIILSPPLPPNPILVIFMTTFLRFLIARQRNIINTKKQYLKPEKSLNFAKMRITNFKSQTKSSKIMFTVKFYKI